MSLAPFRYVPGCTVSYKGPTNTRGSVWVATIRRGNQPRDVVRVRVPFADGPDAAALACCAAFNKRFGLEGMEAWRILANALSISGGDDYAYPVGSFYLQDVVGLPSV